MEFEEAKFKAIKFIGISKKTEHEVIIKLNKLLVSEKIVINVIKYCKDLSYINDNEYCKSFVKQNERTLKYSIKQIKQKLIFKGIDILVIDININKLYNNNYEANVIAKLMKSKFINMNVIDINRKLYNSGFVFNGIEEFE